MSTRVLSHIKTEGRRVVKYTVVFGAIGAGGGACVAKLLCIQLKGSMSDDIIRKIHEKYPIIPSQFHPLTDRIVRKLWDFVFDKQEEEVVRHLGLYGAITGISFGVSTGILRVTVGIVWNATKSVLSRKLNK